MFTFLSNPHPCPALNSAPPPPLPSMGFTLIGAQQQNENV